MGKDSLTTMYQLTGPPPEEESASIESPHRRRQRRMAMLATVIAIIVALLAWHLWPDSLPSPHAGASTLIQFAASERFTNLSSEQKRPYLEPIQQALAESKLPEELRRTARENIMQATWDERLGA